jgi:hypothetical protein
MIHAGLQFVNPKNAKNEENLRILYYYMGKTAFYIAKRRIVSTNLKGKRKSKIGVDKFTLW